jgi:hypothetical protein
LGLFVAAYARFQQDVAPDAWTVAAAPVAG